MNQLQVASEMINTALAIHPLIFSLHEIDKINIIAVQVNAWRLADEWTSKSLISPFAVYSSNTTSDRNLPPLTAYSMEFSFFFYSHAFCVRREFKLTWIFSSMAIYRIRFFARSHAKPSQPKKKEWSKPTVITQVAGANLANHTLRTYTHYVQFILW